MLCIRLVGEIVLYFYYIGHVIFLQDKKINAFDIRSGKLIRWFQHDGDVGDPIKVCLHSFKKFHPDIRILHVDYRLRSMEVAVI